MSLRLAALTAYGALNGLLAKGWGADTARILNQYDTLWDARRDLHTALGIDPIYAAHDRDLDQIGLIMAIAEGLSRRQETARLASEISHLVHQHQLGWAPAISNVREAAE